MASPAGSVDAPQKSDSWIDEQLAPFAVFVDAMSVASAAAISGSEYVPSMWVERLEIELPFEMDVLVEPDGRVRLAGGPPTQYTETTFMPVFHKVKLAVIGEMKSGGDPESNLAS
jgi:hypothetical protein